MILSDEGSWWRQGWLAQFSWGVDDYMLNFFLPQWVVALIPIWFRVSYLTIYVGTIVLVAAMMIQRKYLALLLRYKGWLYERKPSLKTTVWGAIVRVAILQVCSLPLSLFFYFSNGPAHFILFFVFVLTNML